MGIKLSNKATINEKGAILLGNNISVDGPGCRLARVVTHAHTDHLKSLRTSIRKSLFIIATPVTHRFLEVLGYNIPDIKKIELNYYKKIFIENEKIELIPARHIAGSAQVLVEGKNYRVGYTGDFKMPGTPPMKDLDVLVLDATYGSPKLQRRWSDYEALSALITLIEDYIWNGPIWIYGYHGKLQEILLALRTRNINYPIYSDYKTIKLAKIAGEVEGTQLDPLYTFTTPEDIESDSIILAHMFKKRSFSKYPGIHVTLTGWEFRGVVVRTGPNSFNVSFSDHATFSEIIDYVREASPKKIIVDASRSREAKVTSRYIEKYLGIPTIPLP